MTLALGADAEFKNAKGHTIMHRISSSSPEIQKILFRLLKTYLQKFDPVQFLQFTIKEHRWRPEDIMAFFDEIALPLQQRLEYAASCQQYAIASLLANKSLCMLLNLQDQEYPLKSFAQHEIESLEKILPEQFRLLIKISDLSHSIYAPDFYDTLCSAVALGINDTRVSKLIDTGYDIHTVPGFKHEVQSPSFHMTC